MSERINLAELRAILNNAQWRNHTDLRATDLLALIDTVEAAHALLENERADQEFIDLYFALDRFYDMDEEPA